MTNIIERDFRAVDLNLFLVFHALMQERSVTGAARRLFRGQPAVSGSLKRLRAAFADELFVRKAHGMEPTPRALELSRQIQPALSALHDALRNPPEFDPESSDRAFRIGMSDALEVALLPQLVSKLARLAPGVRLISRFTDSARVASMLESGEIELAIGVFREHSNWQRKSALFRWRFVCLFDSRQIKLAARRLTLQDYLRYPHVFTSFSGDLRGFIDEQLEGLGVTRRVLLSSPNFATSPMLIRKIAAFTTVPTFIAGVWRDTLGLTLKPLPFPMPEYEVSQLWASVNQQDAGLAWLRGLLASEFTDFDP
jgi:LysR family transcriptional activator of mexEF-oprN operon